MKTLLTMLLLVVSITVTYAQAVSMKRVVLPKWNAADLEGRLPERIRLASTLSRPVYYYDFNGDINAQRTMIDSELKDIDSTLIELANAIEFYKKNPHEYLDKSLPNYWSLTLEKYVEKDQLQQDLKALEDLAREENQNGAVEPPLQNNIAPLKSQDNRTAVKLLSYCAF